MYLYVSIGIYTSMYCVYTVYIYTYHTKDFGLFTYSYVYIFAYLNIYMCIIVYLYLNICIWWDTWKSTKTYVGCFKQDMCCFSHCRCIYLYIMHHCCIIIFEIIFTVCPFNITIANSKWNETSCSSMPLFAHTYIDNIAGTGTQMIPFGWLRLHFVG